jgi:hypothetical protein
MLASKLFISRLDGAYRNLFERFWDGDEWIWVDHGRPGGVAVTGTPGAAMLDEKLFVVVEDGSLWERHWRADLGSWVWDAHGRPNNQRITGGPGAEMMNEKLFVSAEDGHLWERHWRADLGRWAWEDHGQPPGTRVTTAPGAAMMDSKLFVGTENGHLFERFWNGSAWVWVDHGQPPGTWINTAPAAAMMDSKLFVGAANGRMYERYWNGSAWVWVDHGQPAGTWINTAPGAAMMDSKLFIGGADGRLYERYWNGSAWVWVDHGQPPSGRVNTAPGAAMMDSKLFVGADNGHLFERYWNGSAWVWVDHGRARQDEAQHVLGAPGPEPKLTIAVVGDGYTEDDLDTYRNLVHDNLLGALGLDALAGHQASFRVIRIDLVSIASGVTERLYNTMGTTNPSDDVIVSDYFRPSRLGVIANGEWSHCWFDRSSFTDSRIAKVRRRFAPDADHIVIFVNSGLWGGCSSVGPGEGFFTGAVGREVVAHELGHNLFSLDDEYTNDTQTFAGVSRFANTSEQPTTWSALKWSAIVGAGTPLPTNSGALPGGWNNESSVGAFEGAGGSFSHGLFRPVLRCRMNQNAPPWCPVCAREISADLAVFP